MSEGKITPSKLKAIRQRMRAAGVFEKDVEEKFVRSSGKGGQNLNKVATCVNLHHVPSGIQVKCQKERSQGLNRYLARMMLVEKIEQARLKAERQKRYEEEKMRRKKRRRSRKEKERILADKRFLSKKKEERRKINPQKLDKYF